MKPLTDSQGTTYSLNWINFGQLDSIKTHVLRVISSNDEHYNYGSVKGEKSPNKAIGWRYYPDANPCLLLPLKEAKAYETKAAIARFKYDFDILDADLVVPNNLLDNECFVLSCGHYACEVSGKQWKIDSNGYAYSLEGFRGGLGRCLQVLKDFGCKSDDITITRLGNQFLG
jgi:hypothetical protein